MSRSVRHTPIMGWCSHSDKPGKVKANRALRVATRKAMTAGRDWDALALPLLREVSSVWDFPKDGKGYFSSSLPDFAKYMRK